MSQTNDAQAAFDALSKVDSGELILGEREPCRCLLPDGLVISSETVRGAIRGEVVVSVTATMRDIGKPPRAQERATLNYFGESYKLAVTQDDITANSGLYTFTLAG